MNRSDVDEVEELPQPEFTQGHCCYFQVPGTTGGGIRPDLTLPLGWSRRRGEDKSVCFWLDECVCCRAYCRLAIRGLGLGVRFIGGAGSGPVSLAGLLFLQLGLAS